MFVAPFSVDDGKIKWAGSQADFISFVEYYEVARGLFKSENSKLTTDELGELLLKVIDLDISPYPDFHSMRASVPGSLQSVDKTQKLLDYLNREKQFLEVLVGTGIVPSRETQSSQMLIRMIAKDVLNKLRKYTDPPDKK